MNKKIDFYLIFCIAISAYWFIVTILPKSGLDLRIITIILLCIGGLSVIIKWIQIKYTIKEYIVQGIFLAFLIFVYIKSGANNEGIILLFPAISTLKNTNIKKVTKSMFFTILILEILLLLLTLIGIIPYTINDKGDSYGNSYSMIMVANMHGNANYMPIFILIALCIYTYYENANIYMYITLEIIAIIFYKLFACRTGVILSTILILGAYFIKISKFKIGNKVIKKILEIIIENSQLIMFVFVYVVAIYMYETPFFNFLDKLVSSRIMEAYVYIDRYGLAVFPRKLIYYICDNSQTYIMLSMGLIFTAVYSLLYYFAIKNLINTGKKIEIFLIIVFMLYSYSEAAFIKPFPNFSMLFLIYAFYPNRKVEDFKEDERNKEKKLFNLFD